MKLRILKLNEIQNFVVGEFLFFIKYFYRKEILDSDHSWVNTIDSLPIGSSSLNVAMN